ncbi:prepilin peptidase [Allorhizocola rhizosphaerae]|uniref:prepilin peptidase n=1 Tax=Allorhizocola rhizosphaerae TaxID=1872709 RepID=UPI000E3D481C|nr:A24 family peptidase [Allorhizocola rhizosphaerae]
MTTTSSTRPAVPPALYAVAFTPLLRWLVAHHSTEPDRPWRTRCACGAPLWPGTCGPTGRCRVCATPVSPRPFQLEAATIAAAVILWLSGWTGWALAAYAWWATGMIVLAFVDLAMLRLPHRLTAATTIGFLALLAAGGDSTGWWRAVAAGAVLAALFAVLAVLSRGQLGWGDVALAVPVAAALGWHSWAAVYAGCLLGFGAAAVTAVAMRKTRKLQPGGHLPLGPFLIAGAAAALMWQ